MAILFGSYKFIGRFPKDINSTPESILRHIYKVLSLNYTEDIFAYTQRAMTQADHIKIMKDYLGIRKFLPSNHSELARFMISKAPDPGHYPSWIKLAENFLREQKFILPPNKSLRRIISSARRKGIEEVAEKIWVQLRNCTKIS